MEVKEAIEFACIGREKLLTVSECHKIVDCLRQGEKYKQIVDYLEKYCGYYYWGSSDNLSQLIPKLK